MYALCRVNQAQAAHALGGDISKYQANIQALVGAYAANFFLGYVGRLTKEVWGTHSLLLSHAKHSGMVHKYFLLILTLAVQLVFHSASRLWTRLCRYVELLSVVFLYTE